MTIEKLAQDYARHFETIEPYLWQHEAMLASGHFQDSLEPPSAFDIVVLILWSRLGSPLPEKTALREYRGIDGRTPVTGTEWEYEEALASARTRGLPDILVFRSLEPSTIDTQNPRRRDEQVRQLEALDRFWGRHFAEQGRYLGAYTRFSDAGEFAATLEMQLRKLLERRLTPSAPSNGQAVRVWTKAPFRGLEAYDFEHAPIFFGQDDALTKALTQLVANAEARSPFLLVLGASGSGKSSLVKAGVVPKLFVPRRITGVAFLRKVVFQPSDRVDGEDIFAALARRLTTAGGPFDGLAELIMPGASVADLAAHLRGSASEPAMPFRLALGGLVAAAREKGRMLEFETGQLVLVIDQLEELFTIDGISADERRRFVELLAGLSRSRLVWIIATMRKDFWHRADETPELVRLTENGGRLELLPPTPAQISQMIRRPAEAVGVTFEVHPSTGIPLNEAIAEEVNREPGALPLLSYLLDQLYRSDVVEARDSILTFDTYDRLGRLEGAIATKAEAVLKDSAPEDRRALGSVLFALVQISDADGDVERAVSHRVPLSAFPAGTPQRRLVAALLDPAARLLVIDSEKQGVPTVRVAHEALITRWKQAREFVQANAEALKIRRRIEERYILFRRLIGAGQDDQEDIERNITSRHPRFVEWRSRLERERGLLTEIDLGDGQRLLRDHRAELEPHLVDYIERSATDEKRKRDQAFRALTAVSTIVALLAVLACGAALTARSQERQTLQAQSRLLVEAAAERLKDGNVDGAERIVLEVLTGRQFDGTRSADAINVFEEARAADRQQAVISGHSLDVDFAAFSPDGRLILTASQDKTARIWDAVTGAQIAVLAGHSAAVNSAVFSPDGRQVVTASQDYTARVWALDKGAPVAIFAGHRGSLNSVAYSPDGTRIVTASSDKTARVWDPKTSTQVAILIGHDAAVNTAAFSPNGRRIVTSSDDRTIRLWDAATGAQLAVFAGGGGPLNSAVFSPDGLRILTAGSDKTARLWNSANGVQLAVLAGHGRHVNSATFSPDGRRIVTASNDNTARLWDATTGAQLAVYFGHRASVNSAEFSPDGGRIVTASNDKTARIWGAAEGNQLRTAGTGVEIDSLSSSPDGRQFVTTSRDKTVRVWDFGTGKQLSVIGGHSDLVYSATFSPDGRRIATASLDHTARIWNAATGAPLGQLTGPDEAIDSIAYSRDGRRIVTGSWDDTAQVWDAATNVQVALLSGHRGAVEAVAFSPDGQRIVTASLDDTARVWVAATGALVTVLTGHSDGVHSVAFSPDGRRIVTASLDRTARVWDAATGHSIVVLSGHGDVVFSAAYSPDGRRIVTASNDRTARVWDAATGVELGVLAGHGDSVYSAVYLPDGRHIVTASADKTLRIWDGIAPATIETQIGWSQAAQFDGPSDIERARLGLPAESQGGHPLAKWFRSLLENRNGGPQRLGQLADQELRRATEPALGAQANDLLLSAFEHYAEAAADAQSKGWPDDAWCRWRYKRATLARVLSRRGLMKAAADAYRRATHI